MDAFPDELGYQYEYARALDFSDPDKSIKIYRKLTHQKYPAAFDNLGSLLLRQKDYSGAIAVFQDGAQFDDPDSLVSLANLIQRGLVRGVGNPEATRFALLSRAAQLGHQGAQRAVEELKLEFQQKQQEQEVQQRMLLNCLAIFWEVCGDNRAQIHQAKGQKVTENLSPPTGILRGLGADVDINRCIVSGE